MAAVILIQWGRGQREGGKERKTTSERSREGEELAKQEWKEGRKEGREEGTK
jgi:hypothetical protein